MSNARIAAMDTINQNLLDAQAIAYQNTPTQLQGTPGYHGPTRQLGQPGQDIASESTLKLQPAGEDTVQLAPYVPGVAPGEIPLPPPGSSQNRGRQDRNIAQQARMQGLRAQMGLERLSRSVHQFFQSQNRNVGSIPTPGGIWVPFWILVGLFLILIPVNGHTRLYWFWLALIGGAQISATGNVTQNVGTAIQLTTPITPIPPVSTPTFPGSNGTSIVPLSQQDFIPLTTVGNYLSGINVGGDM